MQTCLLCLYSYLLCILGGGGDDDDDDDDDAKGDKPVTPPSDALVSNNVEPQNLEQEGDEIYEVVVGLMKITSLP